LEIGISTIVFLVSGWKKGIKREDTNCTIPKMAAMGAAFLSIPMRTGRCSSNWLAHENKKGSHKWHCAILGEQALNKWFTFNLLQQLKCQGIVVPNDLKSCNDPIICHSIVSQLCCMEMQGVANESEVVFTFARIQNLAHEIGLAYMATWTRPMVVEYGWYQCKASAKEMEETLVDVRDQKQAWRF
jgi:hypothetical protein